MVQKWAHGIRLKLLAYQKPKLSMYAKINDEPLPEKTLTVVMIASRVGVTITDDALKEQDRLDTLTF